MTTYEIIPHVGIGPIQIAMSRDEVHKLFGKPKTVRDQRERYFDGFFIDYDKNDRVEFIELAKSIDYRAVYHDYCLHEMEADDAVELVSRYGILDEYHRELGYTYIFLDLQLSLWRGTMDRKFESVGIATKGYFMPTASSGMT